jgi:acyl carrier protein
VMKIVAEEIDVDMSELVEEAAFENLGVDSLLSLTISARFREELDMDIPSTLFTDCSTVGELKKHFSQYEGGAIVVDDDDLSDSSNEPADTFSPEEDSANSSPASSTSSSVDEEEVKKFSASVIEDAGGASVARKLVAEEMGVDVSEITDDLDLTDIGMDSLMSLTILGSMREVTGVDLPADFLTVNVTIKDIETALDMRPKPKQQAPAAKPAAKVSTKSPQLAEVNKKLASLPNISNLPPATSVLLQGNPKVATKKFFLVPDGSGSATSYISIPNISPDMAVYGLNCPFMKCPEKWNCGVEGVSSLYLQEIKRRQPEGPYIIGGWSAGGVMAYEVAQQLVNSGEKVENLVLIDAPCPVALDPLPASTSSSTRSACSEPVSPAALHHGSYLTSRPPSRTSRTTNRRLWTPRSHLPSLPSGAQMACVPTLTTLAHLQVRARTQRP